MARNYITHDMTQNVKLRWKLLRESKEKFARFLCTTKLLLHIITYNCRQNLKSYWLTSNEFSTRKAKGWASKNKIYNTYSKEIPASLQIAVIDFSMFFLASSLSFWILSSIFKGIKIHFFTVVLKSLIKFFSTQLSFAFYEYHVTVFLKTCLTIIQCYAWIIYVIAII